MNKARQEKVKRFLADEAMAYHVKEVLREAFLKPTKQIDVQYLAATRIAIDLLEDGFKELAKYQTIDAGQAPMGMQVGL